MRTPSLIAASLLASGLAFAGRSEAVVYTDGNLTGIAVKSKAVLDLSLDDTMKLRVGATDVSVPYASITKADSADSTLVPAPGKKASKPAQQLTIEFKSVQGDSRTMTLYMTRPAASHVLAAIHKHVPDAQTTSAPTPASETAAVGSSVAPAASASAGDNPPAAADDNAKPAKSAKVKKEKPAKVAKAKVDKNDKKDKKNKKDQDNQQVAANDASAKPTPPNQSAKEWWGDTDWPSTLWKTNRNLPKWEQQGSSAPAAQ